MPDINDDVTINGNNSIIDANSTSGIVTIRSTTEINDLEFRHANRSTFGGAILGFHSSPKKITLNNCRFFSNSSSSVGGAIFTSSSSGILEIIDCSFEDNAGTIGGAIAHHGDRLIIENIELLNNTASFGQAIQLLKNSLSLSGTYDATNQSDIAMENGLNSSVEVELLPLFEVVPGSTLDIFLVNE